MLFFGCKLTQVRARLVEKVEALYYVPIGDTVRIRHLLLEFLRHRVFYRGYWQEEDSSH